MRRRVMAWAWGGLLGVSLLRLVVAGLVPLTPDEAYYWVWARAPAWGYYDHPPMVAFWAWAGMAVAGETTLGVRLLAPVSAAVATILLVRAGTDLSGDRLVGVWAGILLNATLGVGLGAVSMTPDTPLLLFWVAAIWAVGRLVATGRGVFFLVLGAAVGLAGLSKLLAAFLALGVGLWLVWVPGARQWLRTPWPWVGGVVAAVVWAPFVVWNAGHGWVAFVRQGGRLGGGSWARGPEYLAEFLGGQIGLLTPLVFGLAVLGMARAMRLAWRERAVGASLLAALCLPGLGLFLFHGLSARVEGNWPAILHPALVLAAAWYGGVRWRMAAAVLGGAMTAVVYWHAAVAPLPLPVRTDPAMKRLAGWDVLAGQVDAAMRAHGAGFVTADDYAVAARLAWELPGVTVLVGQSRFTHFDLARAMPEGSGVLVRSARLADRGESGAWRIGGEVARLERGRDGVGVEGYRVFLVVAGREVSVLPMAIPGWSPR